MKKIILFILPTLFIANRLTAQSNGLYVEKKSCTTAIEYNDYIVDLIKLVDTKWSTAITGSELKATLKASNDLKLFTGKIVKSLTKLEAFGGEVNFKASAIDYVSYMNKLSKKELPTFLKLIHPKGELTPENEKKAEALIPALDDRREGLFAAVENAQATFASKNNFEIAK